MFKSRYYAARFTTARYFRGDDDGVPPDPEPQVQAPQGNPMILSPGRMMNR